MGEVLVAIVQSSAPKRASILLVFVVDEGIDHDADEFCPDAPIVNQGTAFAAKAETFGKSYRRQVVGMNQGLDPMDVQFFGAIV
jgi:hypothetical protein